ncbi:tRNA methyltransferase, partial [Globisporangium splendens]
MQYTHLERIKFDKAIHNEARTCSAKCCETMVMQWPRTPWSIVASVSVLAIAVGAYQYLAWRQNAGADTGADGKRNKPPKPTKEQRKLAKRITRREKKDQQLLAKKHERAQIRTQQQREMTDEQKREQMERIKMQRVEQYQKLDDGKANGVRVVIDLGFAAAQTQRLIVHGMIDSQECHSILKQLGCVYGYLKKCPLDRLISLHVASCVDNIATICAQHGVPGWKVTCHEVPVQELFAPQEVIYLSPDADDVLEAVDPAHVYVIGGIVDRTVRKEYTNAQTDWICMTTQGQSVEKAGRFAYRAARLPLQEHLPSLRSPVLNIDSVVIALNEYANHASWPRALAAAVPKRMLLAEKAAW